MTSTPVLVLGVGNLLLGDEGAGVHVVRRLEALELPGHVELVDGGTGGFHLLGCLRDHARVVIIDAALDGRPPGTVDVRQPRFAADFPRVLTAHDLGLRDLIEAAALLGPLPEMTLLTVSVAAEQPMTTELSPAVEAALDEVVSRVLDLVGSPSAAIGPAGGRRPAFPR